MLQNNLETDHYLNERIERLNKIIEGSGIAPWELNLQTGETIFSKGWAAMLGYELFELEPIDPNTWKAYAHQDDIDKAEKSWSEHLSGLSGFYECELRMKHKDGSVVWIQDSGKISSYTPDGNPEWITGSIKEITARKRSELLLLRYKELLDRTNETANIGTWEVDIEQNTVTWSAVTKKIHEVPPDYHPELEGAIAFFPEGKYRQTILDAFTNAIDTGQNYDLELQILTYKNNLRWVRAIGIAEFEKKVCKKVYGLFQDITEKNQVVQQLSLQEERFRQTFEHAPIGMALVGLDGKWLRVNKKVCDILGYKEHELLQLTFQEITYPDDLMSDMALLKQLVQGTIENYQMEKRYFQKNGRLVWAQLSVSMVKNDAGEPIHFVSQINDISLRKALLDTVQDQNKRLLNFAHIVSHNLRSHSSNFSLMLDLMKMQVPESTQNEFYPMLVKASDNLKDTITHLNEVTLIQTKTEENLEKLNLHQFIKKAIENIKALILKTQAVIHNQVDEEMYIRAVPAYLDSIILNFLTNAIKYRHPDRHPEITLASHLTEHFVVLTVSDNGLGINLAKNREKLFGMYKTFHDNKEARGIGLFITNNQVHSMGGRIEVDSIENTGTDFKIYFQHEKD